MKKWILVLGIFIVLVVVVVFANRGGDEGNYEFSLMHDGLKRTYTVHVPPSYTGEMPTALVLNFHGGTGNAGAAKRSSAMNEKSDTAGFIVVYPEGTGSKLFGKILGLWNAGRCCGSVAEHRDNVDDVGFIEKMLDAMEEEFSINESMIYSTGLSNGALISYRLACEMSDRIAAIAPIGAQDSYDNCNPERPVPVIHFHGTADRCARYGGGDPCGAGCAAEAMGQERGEGWACSSVPDYIDEWRALNGCTGDGEVIYEKGEAKCVSYSGCDEGAEVVLCTIGDGGHTWPGGGRASLTCITAPDGERCKRIEELLGPISFDISANDVMWEFFERHSLDEQLDGF